MKKYNIIYADPAWSYNDKKCNGNCEDHYRTMSLQEMKDLPVQDMCADDCVIFMWITYPMIQEGLELMKSWGFKYKSIGFQWIKLNKKNGKPFFGLGRWTRGNTEACFIGVKGKPKRQSAAVSQLVMTPIREHSRKPDEVRDKIVELMGDLPRLEMFSRTQTEGWDVWGNETSKFVKSELSEDSQQETTGNSLIVSDECEASGDARQSHPDDNLYLKEVKKE